jgi:hypothetical protein
MPALRERIAVAADTGIEDRWRMATTGAASSEPVTRIAMRTLSGGANILRKRESR